MPSDQVWDFHPHHLLYPHRINVSMYLGGKRGMRHDVDKGFAGQL